ncbi:hypothetical protein [Fodinicola feengrottensis]|uniref:hypothetical protein n=1 Tax=Fodinicola feengrottensis TaxID=435914 RepID=UPI0013D402E0|nr:hypothetical protein [Fodinicola feengrottensis]
MASPLIGKHDRGVADGYLPDVDVHAVDGALLVGGLRDLAGAATGQREQAGRGQQTSAYGYRHRL